jgi:hypothetical protein
MSTYIVEERQHGILVKGSIPVDDFAALTKTWGDRGLTVLDTGVAASLGATLVVTNKEGSLAWRAEIEGSNKQNLNGDLELEWLKGTDTGVSSMTIVSVLSEKHALLADGRLRHGGDVPHDPSDFGRCYRLLQLFPEWKARLGEVAAKYPKWKPLVEAWDQLEALWLEESPTNNCPKLYERMQALRKEGDRHEPR